MPTVNSYDPLNHLLSLLDPTGNLIRCEYDEISNRTLALPNGDMESMSSRRSAGGIPRPANGDETEFQEGETFPKTLRLTLGTRDKTTLLTRDKQVLKKAPDVAQPF